MAPSVKPEIDVVRIRVVPGMDAQRVELKKSGVNHEAARRERQPTRTGQALSHPLEAIRLGAVPVPTISGSSRIRVRGVVGMASIDYRPPISGAVRGSRPGGDFTSG